LREGEGLTIRHVDQDIELVPGHAVTMTVDKQQQGSPRSMSGEGS
jgi:hypothetical protein